MKALLASLLDRIAAAVAPAGLLQLEADPPKDRAPASTPVRMKVRVDDRDLPRCPRWAHHEGRCAAYVHDCDPATVGYALPACDRATCDGLHPAWREVA